MPVLPLGPYFVWLRLGSEDKDYGRTSCLQWYLFDLQVLDIRIALALNLNFVPLAWIN
jgi:hypothetical protein